MHKNNVSPFMQFVEVGFGVTLTANETLTQLSIKACEIDHHSTIEVL